MENIWAGKQMALTMWMDRCKKLEAENEKLKGLLSEADVYVHRDCHADSLGPKSLATRIFDALQGKKENEGE